MQHSEAVAAAANAWCEQMSAGDVEGVAATLAGDAEAFAIGTQRIGLGRDAWLESVHEMAAMGVQWEWTTLRAWEAGGAGLAAGEMTASVPGGPTLPMRATAFLVREGEGFGVFHMHFSWAVPDEVAMPQAAAWRDQLAATAAA
jgi:ketosteroid isomerase-like protein